MKGTALQWFQMYLVGRCQYVRMRPLASSSNLSGVVCRRGQLLAPYFFCYTPPTCHLSSRAMVIAATCMRMIRGSMVTAVRTLCWSLLFLCPECISDVWVCQPTPAERSEDRAALVRHQPTSSPASAATATSLCRPHCTFNSCS